MSELNQEQLDEIFRKIASGERAHGGFLTSFAEAYGHADFENKPLLKDVAVKLAEKYHLESYAWEPGVTTFPPDV